MIGEVARDFGLYTKITGGQRIDLFGARMEELPAIWRRLVDAGFESGHAYGKSLRTVKSCVGSTWCRYGVQDSVGLAIALELRYRGLRSPHKLKGGVSGCARECAEARGKDFGVIATEKGWNLYVGGNGGATPAHARLLAGDLDTETLVRYLDRFLMYYIRTADRLQRTAAWIDQLDGGLDRVREVVVDDALGLGAELEAAMARHVGALRRRVAGHPRGPRASWPGSCRSSTRPDTPDPNIAFTHRARPDPARRRPTAGRARRDDPGGSARMTRRRPSTTGPGLPRSTSIEVERGVAALVHGQAVAIFRTHDGEVFALGNHDPFAGRRCWRAASSAPAATSRSWPRRCTSRPSTCAPAQCLDDAAVRVPAYDVRWSTASCTSGRRQEGRVSRPPARGLPDRGHRRPQGRGAGGAAASAAAPRSSGRRRCRWSPTTSTTASCGPRPRRCWPGRSTCSSPPPASA